MPPFSLSIPSDTSLDTPPLSPTSTSATRSSVASSNSSLNLGGDPGTRTSRKFPHDSTMSNSTREGDIEEEMDVDMQQGGYPDDRGRSGYPHHNGPPSARSRPGMMPRQGSYSKRHSSFDTPREVPFPYPYLASQVNPLADHPTSSKEDERSSSVTVGPQGDPNRRSSSRMDTAGDSPGECSEGNSSPPRRPTLERSSTTSLPLPSSTPYSALPPLSSSTSPPHSEATRAPPMIRSTSLNTTISKLDSPVASPPRVSFLKPPLSKSDISSKPPSPPRPTQPIQLERTPSPPFLVDEADMANHTRSNDSQLPSLPPPPHHDPRPHTSLPPPPRFSSLNSSPSMRPTSLPQPIDNSSQAGGSPFPPPQPPTVLTPPPPPSDADTRTPAPYEPFLPREQPPPDHTYIAVETMAAEYRLIVRLPGFQRDSITLSMRRRRILHVVADNWSDGGGHFERRISFGYDADLASVRAEFDGEILRIIVPRREPPGWYTQQTN